MKSLKIAHHSVRDLISVLLLGLSLHTTVQAEVTLGIGTHFAQLKTNGPLFFKWMSGSPFSTFRDEIYWGDVEPAPQQFRPSKRVANTIQALNSAVEAGMDPLIALDYGNQFYDGGSQPYTDSGREGFARYADWVVRATKGRVNNFEIWNEWNIGAGKRPYVRQGDPADYVKLVEAASVAIRKANPNAVVIAGAVADDAPDWGWLREAIRHGLLNHADAISLHLYNHSLPIHKGGAKEMIERLNKVHEILQKSSPSKTVPIYVTEIGWPNNVGTFGVSPTNAAIQATTFLLDVNTLDFVKGVWFYEFQNRGRDTNEREDNFGILDADDRPKAIACAIQNLGQQLKGSQLISSSKVGLSRIVLYRLKNGSQLFAAWTPKVRPEEATQSLEITGSNLSFKPVDMGCFKSSNLNPTSLTPSGMKIEQGYSPSLYILPKDAKINF